MWIKITDAQRDGTWHFGAWLDGIWVTFTGLWDIEEEDFFDLWGERLPDPTHYLDLDPPPPPPPKGE